MPVVRDGRGALYTSLVGDALDMAVSARHPDEDALLIHHCDDGSQYTSATFSDALVDHGLLASLGSTGDAYDTQSRSSLSASPAWI
jgi:putative transposase